MRYSFLAMVVGIAGGCALLLPITSRAQISHPKIPTVISSQNPPTAAGIVLQITLDNALQRAKLMSPTLQSALMNAKVARENRVQEWSANLPSVTGVSTYLYTEGNGTLAARFIANNGVHEYIAQADAHELLSAAQVVQYRRSILSDTLARDQASVAQRGLVVTVVQSYAALVAAENKYKTLQQALEAARDFVKTTEQLEKGGEVAHADVLKARIQFADSEVAAENAQLAQESARLTLALLLFPDVNQKFEAVDDLGRLLVLPSLEEAQTEAVRHNPSLDASRDSERLASEGVTYAKTGYLPTLTFDYFYGIDANQFAARTETKQGPIQNLGYSAMATLNVPIWNWGATQSKVRQAQFQKRQATMDRIFAQHKLTADLEQFYGEAKVAKSEMDIREASAKDAEESLGLTLLRYKAGDTTALEVVTAQDTLSQERNAFEDARTRYATALANLSTLTGTL